MVIVYEALCQRIFILVSSFKSERSQKVRHQKICKIEKFYKKMFKLKTENFS